MDARRAEQNCAAQRAFRRRKEQHVKDLEDKVRGYVQLQKRLLDLEHDNYRLKHRLWELEGCTSPQPHTHQRTHDFPIRNPHSSHSHCSKEQEQKNKVLDDLADLLRSHHRPPI